MSQAQRSAVRARYYQKNKAKWIGYRAKNRDWLLANRRAKYAADPSVKWAVDLKKKYGLTIEQYSAMFIAQGGVCALCLQPETSVDHRTKVLRRLAVDHHHETKKVRQLLCSRCNRAIGLLRDNADLVFRIATYLRSHE